MTFHSASCEVCKKTLFGGDILAAYSIASRIPESVNLAGRQPWSGVRVVCADCLDFLRHVATERASS